MANIKFNARHGITVGSNVSLSDNLGNVTPATLSVTGLSTLAAVNAASLNITGAVSFATAPTGITPAVDDASTKLATTQFIRNQFSTLSPTMNGIAAAGVGIKYSRDDHVHPIDTSRAPTASPTFTGTATAAALSVTGNTSIATLTITGAVTGSLNVTTGNDFKINGVSVLNVNTLGAGVVNSSLTTLGTITAGVWSGTPVAIVSGGTGATSPQTALNGLLPAGRASGYILKTDGVSGFYWAAETGASTIQGTRIDSQRTNTTATAGQTLFTTPTYVPGTGQLRVYINGVRQYISVYTESSTTTVSLNAPGASAGDLVMCEVDGYLIYNTTATGVTYTATGSLPGGTVQDALATLDTNKAAVNQIMYLGTTAVAINRTSAPNHVINGVKIDGVGFSSLAAGFTVSGGTTTKTLTVNNTLALSGTDGSTLNIGGGGTLGTGAYANIANYALLSGGLFTGQTSVATTLVGDALIVNNTTASTTAGAYSRLRLTVGTDHGYMWQATAATTAWGGGASLNIQGMGNINLWTGNGASTGTVYIRGALSTLGITATANISTSGHYIRTAAGVGNLDGNYPSAETNSTTGAIYTLGANFRPTSTTFAAMYGIGYTVSDVYGTAIPGFVTGHWGMYVAGGGIRRISLNAVNGNIGTVGAIYAGGDIVAFASSDKRLKTNVKPITDALSKVNQLSGFTYEWNEEGLKQDLARKAGHREVGVSAQEIEAVLAEVVSTRDDGYKAVKYERIIPLLIEAIKELSAEVEDLKRGQLWQSME